MWSCTSTLCFNYTMFNVKTAFTIFIMLCDLRNVEGRVYKRGIDGGSIPLLSAFTFHDHSFFINTSVAENSTSSSASSKLFMI